MTVHLPVDPFYVISRVFRGLVGDSVETPVDDHGKVQFPSLSLCKVVTVSCGSLFSRCFWCWFGKARPFHALVPWIFSSVSLIFSVFSGADHSPWPILLFS